MEKQKMQENQERRGQESKFVSMVVYIQNDEERILPFFQRVLPLMRETFEKYEIICVNDGSVDGSVERLKEFFKENQETAGGNMMQIIHMSYFQGVEASMNAGRDMAIGDFVSEFDDICLDYPLELIVQIYHRLLEGYDVVAAGRKGGGKLSSGLFYWLYNMTSHSGSKIGQETFRILSRRAINRVMSIGKYIPYRKAIYMNCGLKTDTVYYEGKGKKGRKVGCRKERTSLALDSFIYFTNGMEKASLLLSGVFLFFTLGVAIYLACSVFSANKPVEGWLSTMGFLSFGFFGVFTLLTIILKYLSVMISLIFKHQRYLVESVEKITG